MYCRNCGKEIYNNQEYCEECKAKLQENQEQISTNNVRSDNLPASLETRKRKRCCPKCKSRDFQLVTNTEFHSKTNGGGFSAGKGCCGYMALGPLGLLCGACGSKSKTTVTSVSTSVWVCHDCGNKFRDVEEIDNDIKNRNLKFVPKFLFVMGIFEGINSLCWLVIGDFLNFLLCLLICGLFFGGRKLLNDMNDRNINALYEERKYIEENGYIDE